MKKNLLLLMVIFSIKISFSQTEKGSKFIVGDLNLFGASYNFQDTLIRTNSKYSNFNVSPKIGYFVKNNLALGLSGNFGVSTYNSKEQETSISISFGSGLFCRKFIPINEKLKVFINSEIDYGYNKTKFHSNGYNSVYVSNSISANIIPGLTYFATKKLAISASIGKLYSSIGISKSKNYTYNYPDETIEYGFDINRQNILLGVNYFF